MKEIVVISGKGGTGKTSIVASLAALAESKVMVDCDVDAADLYLLLQPVAQEEGEFWSGQKAVIDRDKCTSVGFARKCAALRQLRISRLTLSPVRAAVSAIMYALKRLSLCRRTSRGIGLSLKHTMAH